MTSGDPALTRRIRHLGVSRSLFPDPHPPPPSSVFVTSLELIPCPNNDHLSFSTGTPSFLPFRHVPKIQMFGHLPIALLNKPAGTHVPWAWVITQVCTFRLHLTSVFMHPTLPPSPAPNPTTNMHAGAPPFSAQHQGTENLTEALHTPFPRKHTHVHTASQDSELGAVSAGWAPPLPSRQRGCRPQREQRPSGCREGGAEAPASSSLAMLVCLGSTATASSGSDCRVNHSDDLNNYRLLKSGKKKKTKQGNK